MSTFKARSSAYPKANRFADWQAFTDYSETSALKKTAFIINTVLNRYQTAEDKTAILDIGCGTGSVSLPLASLGFNVTGLDLDPTTIAFAQKRNPFSNAQFQVQDVSRLDSQYFGKFDVALCSELLDILRDPEKLLNATVRLVKLGGLVIITIPNGYGPYQLIREMPTRVIKKLLAKPDLYCQKRHFYSFESIRSILALFGLRVDLAANSDFTSFWPGIARINWLSRFDCKAADFLPYWLASGWYFACTSI